MQLQCAGPLFSTDIDSTHNGIAIVYFLDSVGDLNIRGLDIIVDDIFELFSGSEFAVASDDMAKHVNNRVL